MSPVARRIPAGLSISGSPGPATRTQAFSFAPVVSGGVAPYACASTGTALPAGLSLAGSTGVVSGTPTASAATLGIDIHVTDSTPGTPLTADLSFAIVVSDPLALSGTPGDATVGAPYSFTPTAAGGRGTKSYELTGALPDGLDFDPSTGAIGGAPTTAGATAGLDVTVTDADGRTASLGTFDIVVSAVAATPAPYADAFAGAAGTITGRAVGDKAWAGVHGTSGNNDPNVLDGSGRLNGANGSLPNFSASKLDTGTSAGKWWRAEMNANPGAAAAFAGTNPTKGWFAINAANAAGTDNWDRMVFNATGSTINFYYAVGTNIRSGAATELLHTNTDSAGKGVYPQAGDVFELRKKTVGASVFIEPYYNGQQIGPDLDITSRGVTLNDNFAIIGDLQATAQLDAVMVGDPAVHAMISVYAPRVPQVNADGSFTVAVFGDYAGPAPGGLTWTLYDKATDTPVTGYVDQPVASFATGAARTASSAGSWSGRCAVAGGAVASTGAYVVVTRSGLAGGAVTTARSAVFTPGQVALMYGQSLTVKMWAGNWIGLAFTPPANAWTVDGSPDNNGSSTSFPATTANRKTRPVAGSLESPLNTSWLAYQLNQAAGASVPLSMIRAGEGGTYYYQRQPSDPTGTGIWAAMLEGLRLAGGDVGYVFDCAGEYEAAGAPSTVGSGYTLSSFAAADQTNLIGYIQATYDGLDALTGRACKVLMRPIGAIFTGSDVRCEAMRRLQWQLTQDFPSRYVLGGYVMEQQHVTSSDQYHFVSYQEQARRLAWAMAKNLGLAAFDRSGPKLSAVTAWSDTSVTVRFDKNGASALEVVNTVATITDYRGGLTFATDAGFTAEKVPTAVGAPVDVDATFAEVTWSFAAGSFATKPFVRGPYGFNPFNRTNNATINAAIQTGGSMVRGVFTGEDQNVPVQPYYAAAGDYIAGA